MDFMAALARHFLDAIQPNDLTLNRTARFLGALLDGDVVGMLLSCEVGFLVCATIMILSMVLIPVAGSILACCRCHWRCERVGTLQMEQTYRMEACRRTLYLGLVISSCMVLLGNTCMFMSNAAWGVDRINGTLNSLHSYFTDVPKQFDHMMNQSYKIIDEINQINIHQLGIQIQKSVGREVSPTLSSVGHINNSLSHANATNDLETFSTILKNLSKYTKTFSEEVSNAVDKLNKAIKENTDPGRNNTLHDFVRRLNFSEIFNFESINHTLHDLQSALDDVGWDSLINTLLVKGNTFVENIPQKVINDTKDVVQRMRDEVEDTKTHLSNVPSNVLASVSTNVTDALQRLQETINRIIPVVERAEVISRKVHVALCCLVLLVVVFNFLGLVLGSVGRRTTPRNLDPLGPRPQPEVIIGSCAHCGGNSLLVSAGFIFVLSSLLMGVVLMLFVSGGTMYTLVCKPWKDRELLKLIDAPRLFGFELGSMLGLKRNLTLHDVYSDCQENRSLWSTLHMHDLINLEQPLNMSTDVILSSINTTLNLLSYVQEHTRTLCDRVDQGRWKMNFSTFTQQVDKIVNGQLNTTCQDIESDLDAFKNDLPLTIKRHVRAAKSAVESAKDALIYEETQNLSKTLSKTAQSLQYKVNIINVTVSNMLRKVRTFQHFLDNNITQIILDENRGVVDRQLSSVFMKHSEWTNLIQQLAPCEPVAIAVDSVANIICGNVVGPLNAFWFSLALCLTFFIPSVIFSIKLAKYYRRTKEPERPLDDSNHLSRGP